MGDKNWMDEGVIDGSINYRWSRETFLDGWRLWVIYGWANDGRMMMNG